MNVHRRQHSTGPQQSTELSTDGTLAALLERPLRPQFTRFTVTIGVGEALPYEEARWRGALVVVSRGEIELEGASGQRARFGSGDLLVLSALPLHAVRCVAADPAVLVVVIRGRDRLARSHPPEDASLSSWSVCPTRAFA